VPGDDFLSTVIAYDRRMATDRPGTGSRLERRKAHTQRKLLDAARAMLAEGTSGQVSIQGITEAADVGFGSFYNHFSSKAELFEAAVADVLEEMGVLLDKLSSTVDDPAAAFAQSMRLAGRLAHRRPQVAQVLVRHGLVAYIGSEQGLAPRALRDISAGIAAGRFRAPSAKLALACAAGSLLATLQIALTDPDFADDAVYDQLAEQLLIMLGVDTEEAHTLATLALPDTGTLE
jgi:AcrR family transcriptional regulator